MTNDIAARLARLEAAEAVRAAVARYTYLMDGGFVDDLLDVFTEDAEFRAENEPPGSGGTVFYHGRTQIDGHYRPLPFGWFRHHTTNVSIDISADARHAELSSYFLTAFPGGVQGGLYEGSLRLESDGVWRIARWQITSGWGWGGEAGFHYFEQLADHTRRAGKPVLWGQTCQESTDYDAQGGNHV